MRPWARSARRRAPSSSNPEPITLNLVLENAYAQMRSVLKPTLRALIPDEDRSARETPPISLDGERGEGKGSEGGESGEGGESSSSSDNDDEEESGDGAEAQRPRVVATE